MKNIYLDDTIAAISTPIGSGGIGIVRISGERAVETADKIFMSADGKKLSEKKSHTITYGHAVDPATGETVDEVLASLMLSPRTYTREDIVEINCHGGMLVTNRVLELALNNGARLAEPGEFTKRAFLNGRIDLSQAEAVMDIIDSKTELSRKTALNQLGGSVREKVHELREEILDMTAAIEAAIDYPEHDVEEETYSQMRERAVKLKNEIDRLVEKADMGRIIREGVEAVILGRPNVGKSSLLNLLLMEERAIVTDIPGTTRDTVEEYMNLGGIPVKIVDTAGIREQAGEIEAIGIDRAKKILSSSDVVVCVSETGDFSAADGVEEERLIRVFGKSDGVKPFGRYDVALSSVTGEGIEELKKLLAGKSFGGRSLDSAYVIEERHYAALVRARDKLKEAIAGLENFPLDLISLDLREAWRILGEITGETADEEIISTVFEKFCVGK